MNARSALALLDAALLAGPGCTQHHIVSVDELRKLDGYTYRRGVDANLHLRTNDGATIAFNAANDLWLVGPEPEVRGHFRSIRLTPTSFEGVLAGSDDVLRADLASVFFAKVETIDGGKSLLLGATIASVGVSLLYGFFLWSLRPTF